MGEQRTATPPTILVGPKGTIEYVFECLSRLNRGCTTINVMAIGQCIAKAAEVAHMLEEFGITCEDGMHFDHLSRGGIRYTRVCTPLIYKDDKRFSRSNGSVASEAGVTESNVTVDFPTYHLLLDFLLSRHGPLTIHAPATATKSKSVRSDKWMPVLELSASADGFEFAPPPRSSTLSPPVVLALYRCGAVWSPTWRSTGTELSVYDDIVIGLDTNVLYDCVVSQHLLDSFMLCGHQSYMHTPNWTLLVVPSTVMHEVEQAANDREEYSGKLDFYGRRAFRGMQELLELERSRDIRGISLIITGETNPVLDTRVELRALRDEFRRAGNTIRSPAYRRGSAGDTLIRDQYKAFLRQVSFHKGCYFLTSDKTSAALAEAEGLHSIYYQRCTGRTLMKLAEDAGDTDGSAPESYRLRRASFDQADVSTTVPLSKLVYELAVEFGEIRITCSRHRDYRFQISCDREGRTLEPWLYRELIFSSSKRLDMLKAEYDKRGGIPLEAVSHMWHEWRSYMVGWS